MKKLALSRLTIALCLIFAVNLGLGGAAQAAVRMPSFVLKSAVDGQPVDSRNFAGKVLLVAFFASWCPPCIEEIPSFIELQNTFGDKGFSVIALSIDQGGPREVARLIEQKKINYPVLMADNETMEGFGGVYTIPVSFLVNAEGNVMKKYPTYMPKSILQKDILQILD